MVQVVQVVVVVSYSALSQQHAQVRVGGGAPLHPRPTCEYSAGSMGCHAWSPRAVGVRKQVVHSEMRSTQQSLLRTQCSFLWAMAAIHTQSDNAGIGRSFNG